MSTYYSLLGVEPTAPTDEVKRAFRREVARYHPDKVQHLGPEFQEIATTRAAALTEAYRVLMDVELRQRYDEQLAHGAPPPGASTAAAAAAPYSKPVAVQDPEPSGQQWANRPDPGALALVTRAVLAKVKHAAESMNAATVAAAGFDAGYQIGGRRSIFRGAEPVVRVVVKVVGRVDADAVQSAWSSAARLVREGETLCLLLLGSGLAPSPELAGAVAEQRRKARRGGPLLVPVDLRDWHALLPPETPPAVRSLLDRIRRRE